MGWPYQQKPPMGWPLDYDSGLADFVGAWFMREGSGGQVFDLSGNGNTGTFVGGPTWTGGKFGSAIDFTDDDYINCGAGSSLNVPGDFTISFWLYKKGNQPHDYAYIILKRATGGTGRIAILMRTDGSLWRWDDFDTGFNLSNNQWYHIVYAMESTSATEGTEIFYLDGVFLNSRTGTMVAADTTQNFTIGAAQGGTPYPINAYIDNTMIYNRALSASEIALLYRQPFAMFKDPAEIALLGGYQVAVGTILPQITSAYMRI